jgi:hypothetical protein
MAPTCTRLQAYNLIPSFASSLSIPVHRVGAAFFFSFMCGAEVEAVGTELEHVGVGADQRRAAIP